MRYAAGYDRPLAGQFFRRTFRSLAAHRLPSAEPWHEELEYLAERLAEMTVFSSTDRIGSPWYWGNPEELVQATDRSMDRLLLQRAETAANQMLLFEGLLARGLHNIRGSVRGNGKDSGFRLRLASDLYRNAADGWWLTEREQALFLRLAEHARPWAYILALIPGNDYLEMLGGRTATTLILP